jgi:nuclear pore complex protein Nup62
MVGFCWAKLNHRTFLSTPSPNLEMIVSRMRVWKILSQSRAIYKCNLRVLFYSCNLQLQFTSFAQPQGKCLLLLWSMNACMYVPMCVFVWMYVCPYVCVCMNVCMSLCVCLYGCMYVPMCVFVWMYVCPCVCVCMNVRIPSFSCFRCFRYL